MGLSVLVATLGTVRAQESAYFGAWELTIPGGGAGWLGVDEDNGQLHANLLWGGGSVVPVKDVKTEMGRLVLTRKHSSRRKGKDGKTITRVSTETIVARADGDDLHLLLINTGPDGKEKSRARFTGHREPPMPPAPDLSQVKFGEPIQLFNGKDLTGWRLVEPDAINGWSVKDGVLVNDAPQHKGKPRQHYGNLRTDKEFNDFNLTLEVCVPEKGNSGVYLRGIYEVQVLDSYGKPLDSHNMGAIYSRIKPTVAAEKPAGEWETLNITLVQRHVTVILNGKKIIDNQPIAGCTGGALWSDVTRPGPIMLQGDHSSVRYRNIVLRPVVNN
jgi:3-keto-disaccharide hydrolase